MQQPSCIYALCLWYVYVYVYLADAYIQSEVQHKNTTFKKQSASLKFTVYIVFFFKFLKYAGTS